MPNSPPCTKARVSDEVSSWSVYILRCADGSLYTGITTDVTRRVEQHSRGTRGAKYLRGRGPLRLVYERIVGDRGTASRVEYRIKALSRKEKEDFIRTPEKFETLFGQAASPCLAARRRGSA